MTKIKEGGVSHTGQQWRGNQARPSFVQSPGGRGQKKTAQEKEDDVQVKKKNDHREEKSGGKDLKKTKQVFQG